MTPPPRFEAHVLDALRKACSERTPEGFRRGFRVQVIQQRGKRPELLITPELTGKTERA